MAFNGRQPSRGRPRKEMNQLSTRSLRRRIGEDFIPLPSTSEAPDRSPITSDEDEQGAATTNACSGGDIADSGDDPGDRHSDFERSIIDCVGSGTTSVIDNSNLVRGTNIDSPVIVGSKLPSSNPGCTASGNSESTGDNGHFNEIEKAYDLSEFDENIFDATHLGILHYECDTCISCQCINDCDVCVHSDNGECFHCGPCLLDQTSETSGDEEDGNDLQDVEDVVSEEEVESEEDIVLSEKDKANRAMKNDLVDVVLKNNLTHAAITDILGFLRKHDVGNFPSTAKTLLKTVNLVKLKEVPPGHYWHNGITKFLLKYATQTGCSSIKVMFSVDGVQVDRSTTAAFWPLTCKFDGDPEVHLIGLYLGSEKPADPNIYLQDFFEEITPLCQNGLNVNGTIVVIDVDSGIFDAPAKCFMLNVVSFNSTFGCSKCLTKGEMVNNRMCYPDLNAPPRTDESFVGEELTRYHKGRTTLANIPRFGCVTSIPLDYMHLLLLGLMRKLIYLWIGGPLPVRLGAHGVNEISALMLRLIGWLPSEFTRRTIRSLQHLKRFKATEFRLILLYIGIIIFSNMPQRLYEHFLVLHVITTIFIDRSFCKTHIDYAEQLSVFFVKSLIDVYGQQYVSHNVHCLIHLHEDVRKFGPLDDFSAFPFENYYRFLRKFVRKGEKPLQQAAKRYLELEANKCKVSKVNKVQPKPFQGGGCNSRGILVDGCFNPQYSSLTLPGGACISTLSEPDRCCIVDESVVLVENFASNSQGNIVVIGKQFLEWSDVYSFPCKSSVFGIMHVRKLSCRLKFWPASQIVRKCFRMPWKNGFVVLPLHAHKKKCYLNEWQILFVLLYSDLFILLKKCHYNRLLPCTMSRS